MTIITATLFPEAHNIAGETLAFHYVFRRFRIGDRLC
jgi:hypothetical protein